MNSRERVKAALSHIETDRVPVDLGSTSTTGINLYSYLSLMRFLGIESKDAPFVYDPMQMLCEVDESLLKRLSGDVIGLHPVVNCFGTDNRKTSIQKFSSECTCRISSGLRFSQKEKAGDWEVFIEGNSDIRPRAIMPANQMFFDVIPYRQTDFEEAVSGKAEFSSRFSSFTEDELNAYQKTAQALYKNSDYAIVADLNLMALGGYLAITAPGISFPKGIRSLDTWLETLLLNPDYVHEVFSLQCDKAIHNAILLHEAVGNDIEALFVSGTDFGTQDSLLLSKDIFRSLYKPYYTRFNTWVHEHTSWKTFYHSCGAVYDLLPDFIEMGVDIINPVQFTAKGMELQRLKSQFGDQLVFWGGGVDTQHTLVEGPAEKISDEVRNITELMKKDGGFVFAPIHNIQKDVPAEHIIMAYDAINQ